MQRLDDRRRELTRLVASRRVLVGNRRDGFRAVDQIGLESDGQILTFPLRRPSTLR